MLQNQGIISFESQSETILHRAVRESRRETARRMKADGMSIIAIAAYTDLSADEIETL
ncbi:hypothetical protein FACS1894170_03520 [Planctomycetales bacterium]|nr:hypothetical protein FACS1894170_03520 [Planctomycetales bacterium]